MIKKDGFNYSFNSSACASCGGECCIGESGYIWVSRQEIENIANFLKIDIKEFAKEYLIRAKNRYSLKEIKTPHLGYACIFFDIQKRVCNIYEVRPTQCRSFPFWEQFKSDYNQLIKECPGVIVDEK
ncbi:MAG: YkgJ family cysteine cluster protein [Epsilonproteobacteria bacterium]|nr:YkgJ family cysteine cluster protein [Campylobacterota bacterium]